MHQYASTTPESRELVAELEFLWDQIKSNHASSTTPSPLGPQRPSSSVPALSPLRQQQRIQPGSTIFGTGRGKDDTTGESLRILSPVSDGDGDSEDDDVLSSAPRRQSIEYRTDHDRVGALSHNRDYDLRNRNWRRRIEQTLIKLTTEIAALREQYESKGVGRASAMNGTWWIFSFTVSAIRHLAIDAMVVALLVLWVGRRDERAINALRSLAQVLRERFKRVGWKK